MSESCFVRFLIFLIVFYFRLNLIQTIDKNIVSVQTKSGFINGKIQTPIDEKPVNVFKGIPYAEPPVGKLRFRRPLPKDKWMKPVDAYQFQSVCHQDINFFDIQESLLNKNVSEDCLYLNIWSPISDADNRTLKPVMFWIHGGGLLLGSPSENYYQGDILASKGDVVVVSVAYRLNTFGFLYTGTDDAPGNVGLWDQVLALKWVSDNIKYFGGDSNQITIFGESAGAWSVSLLIISPVSRDLFKNAILNSGAYIYKLSADTPEDHIDKWITGAKKVGCYDHQNSGQFTQEIIDCLRDIEPSKLVSIADDWNIIPGTIKAMDLVVTDGWFLPEKPNKMILSGNFKQDVNIMISTVEDEGSFLITHYNDYERYHPINPHNLTFNEAYTQLRDMTSGLNTEPPVNGEQVAKIYYTGLSDSSGYDLLRRRIGIAIGDYKLTCPTVLFAKELFRRSEFKANVYQYYFNSKLPVDSFCTDWMGVCHFSDVFPMFGIPFIDQVNYDDKHRQMSEQMIQFLTDFAKTGTPTNQNGSVWPKYYRIDDNIIAPYYEISYESENKSNFKIGYKISECEYLWKKYII